MDDGSVGVGVYKDVPTDLTTLQYILNWMAMEFAILWYVAFSNKFVCRFVRFFVKNGFDGLWEYFQANMTGSYRSEKKEKTEKSPKSERKKRSLETGNSRARSSSSSSSSSSLTECQLPAFGIWARLIYCTSLLLLPFFIVTIPQINDEKDYTSVDWFVDVLVMLWFMFVPTFLITIRFPNRDNLDLLNDGLFVVSLWLPWQGGLLPSRLCSLSPNIVFPISHIVMLNLGIFLVHIPSRLHHRLGFDFSALFRMDLLMYSTIGFLFCFALVVPFGYLIHFFFLTDSDNDIILFGYLSFFVLQYFLYAMVLEIFFRGIFQNLIEFHLEKRFPSLSTSEQQKEGIMGATSPFLDNTGGEPEELLRDLSDGQEENIAPTTTRRVLDFLALPRNALISLVLTSFVNGLVFLGVPHGGLEVPNVRYAVVSFFLALSYGWVWRKTSKVTASALTHALFNLSWYIMFYSEDISD